MLQNVYQYILQYWRVPLAVDEASGGGGGGRRCPPALRELRALGRRAALERMNTPHRKDRVQQSVRAVATASALLAALLRIRLFAAPAVLLMVETSSASGQAQRYL